MKLEIKLDNFNTSSKFKMNKASFLKNKGNLILFFFCFMFSCKNDRNKDKHTSIVRICTKNLFVETYTIFGGGAYGGDKVSDYLTDSINFRIYIGTYNNGDEAYSYECRGDSINIYKVIGTRENKNRIINTRIYSLLNLEKKKIFE